MGRLQLKLSLLASLKLFHKYLVLIVTFTIAASSIYAQESKSATEYLPVLSGVVRGRWEVNTDDGVNRFAIRNARIKVSGKIGQPLDYLLQTDICQLGKIVFLDAWLRLAATKQFKIQVGQFRIPFGVDPFRGPANYYFANRSFIGRDGANLRSVGIALSYKFNKIPLLLESGVFNTTPITEHSTFNHDKIFAGKATIALGDFKVVGGFESIKPAMIRMNLTDAALIYDYGRWHAEAEYINIHYTNSAFNTCHSYNIFGNYAMPIKAGIFNGLSFQGRWEGSGAYSNGKPDTENTLTATHPERKRLTIGSTISYFQQRIRCDLRLNFEKYFYNDGQIAPEGREDKICAEVVIVF